jgi:hypothetical protein
VWQWLQATLADGYMAHLLLRGQCWILTSFPFTSGYFINNHKK